MRITPCRRHVRTSLRHLLIALLPAAPALYGQTAPAVSYLPLELLMARPRISTVQVDPVGARFAVIEMEGTHPVIATYDGDLVRKGVVFRDTVQSVNHVRWSGDGRWLLTLHDKGGDEGYHLLRIDAHSPGAPVRDLTPFAGAQVDVLATPAGTATAIIESNHRDARVTDVYRLDITTGVVRRIATNPGDVTQWVVSARGVVVAAAATLANGTLEIRAPVAGTARWRVIHTAPPTERFTLLGVDNTSGAILALSSAGRTHEVMLRLDPRTGRVLQVTPGACDGFDAGTIVQTIGGTLLGESCAAAARTFHAASAEARAVLSRARDGGGLSPSHAIEVESASADGSVLVLYTHAPTDPGRFLLLHTRTGQMRSMFPLRPNLPSEGLAPTTFHWFTARDGLRLSMLITRSRTSTATRQPVVMVVHGGPWTRDELGFSGETQFLANRGYTVLQVNFRGSTGLGRATAEGALHEFGRRMSDDLLDGLTAAAAVAPIDTARVCILGGSYGGFAALVGMTRDAARYRCGIDYAGPIDLETLVRAFPPSWLPFLPRSWYRFVGNPADSADRVRMRDASPLAHLDSARGPLLVFHGANDPRVRTAQAIRVMRAWQARGLPATLLFADNEGHDFNEESTALAVNRAVEQFLGQWLGGYVQPTAPSAVDAALRRLQAAGDSLLRATPP